jgi:hypothetical protein
MPASLIVDHQLEFAIKRFIKPSIPIGDAYPHNNYERAH